jgi:hypothetical protein
MLEYRKNVANRKTDKNFSSLAILIYRK